MGTRTGREKKMLDKEMSRLDKWLIMITEKDKWVHRKSANFRKFSERIWKVVSARADKLDSPINFYLLIRESNTALICYIRLEATINWGHP